MCFKGELRYFLNRDLISGMKYVYVLTENRLAIGELTEGFLYRHSTGTTLFRGCIVFAPFTPLYGSRVI